MIHSRFRVAVDVTAIPDQPVGAGRYVMELVRALALGGEIGLTVVTRREDSARWRGLVEPAGTVVATAPSSRTMRVAYGEFRLAAVLSGISPPVDVVHGPHYSLPRHVRQPAVVTVHDLTFVEHPEWHERSKVLLFRRALRLAAKNAKVVICVSEYTAKAFVEHFDPIGEVRVIPNGVDLRHFTATPVSKEHDKAVLSRYRLDSPYVFHLGTLEPRKGIATLIEAFDLVTKKRRDPLDLVLGGRSGWKDSSIERALKSATARERIRQIGYVEEDDVPALLRNAVVVAYPSSEEGFGLPALEAIACGAPLVTSAGTVMEEVTGSAALHTVVGDVGALAAAISSSLDPSEEKEQRRSEGIRRARDYGWDVCAVKHIEAYRRAFDH